MGDERGSSAFRPANSGHHLGGRFGTLGSVFGLLLVRLELFLLAHHALIFPNGLAIAQPH
jgi:hypothetical protein